MKTFLFLVAFLLVDLAAPWPFSNERDDDNGADNGGDDDNDDDHDNDNGVLDEAFLTGANRTYTFGECSPFVGLPAHLEMVTSRCGSPRAYYSSIITFRVTTPSWSSSTSNNNNNPCCGRLVDAPPPSPCLLTCLKALDLKAGGSAKTNVTILEGGVGRDFTRFRVDGELGKGYYYLMQGYTNCTTGVTWRQVNY